MPANLNVREESAMMNDPSPSGVLSAAELFREHGAFVARFLYRSGVPAEAIEDAVQDVFLVVHQRGGFRPGPAKPTTYLALIASRAASAQRRQQRLRAARMGSTPPDDLHARDGDPALRFEQHDDLRRLQEALSRLDPALRETLLLAEFEDEPAPAIAHAMGVPVGTVYWRLHEARKKFQRALAVTDGSRAQAASQRLSARGPGRLARGAKLSAMFGLFGMEDAAEAHALLRTWREAAYEFDPARGLQRHLELAAELPAPSGAVSATSAKLSLGTGAGVAKVAALVAAAVCGIVATVQVLSRAPAGVSEQAARRESLVQSVATASVPIETSPPAGAESAAESAKQQGQATRPAEPAEVRSPAAHDSASASSRPAQQRSAPGRVARSAAASVRGPLVGDGDSAPSSATAHEQSASATAHEQSAGPTSRSPALDQNPRIPRHDASVAPSTTPAKPGDHHDALREARALARAERLLKVQPAQALAIVEELSRTSHDQYLAEERDYIQVMALSGAGRHADAARAADRFLSRYPASVFRARVNEARTAASSRP